ncbi:MAG TPA: thiamine-phosphate kinase [Burkholderiaceae bacterium]|nr:thiamine-phosphate kinase [Burkholderiaceae bacterium]
MGEFELIRRYFVRANAPRDEVQLGIGDDCALLNAGGSLAISTDMLVEGRHFFREVAADALGHKALAVNLSDLAAMGAEPIAFTLALALPHERAQDDAWLSDFARGLFALADRHHCALIGGDTTAGPLAITITVFGRVEPARALRRDGARAGDDIWISGTLGDAALALRAMNTIRSGQHCPPCHTLLARVRHRLERPEPRVALGRALLDIATSAIDLSDGLAGDIRRVLERSRLGAEIALDRLPISDDLASQARATAWRCAVAGGDDYELCFTANPQHRTAVEHAAANADVRVTRIGRMVDAPGLTWLNAGESVALDVRGYDHFSA